MNKKFMYFILVVLISCDSPNAVIQNPQDSNATLRARLSEKENQVKADTAVAMKVDTASRMADTMKVNSNLIGDNKLKVSNREPEVATLVNQSPNLNNEAPKNCRVQTNNRSDGAVIRYLSPDRIGKCDKFYMAVSMQTNGSQYYIATISVFPEHAQNLVGDLTIMFDNKNSATFKNVNSRVTTYNGYPATFSIFLADSYAIKNIESANLKYLLVRLDDNTYQNVLVDVNSNILKTHYDCLK